MIWKKPSCVFLFFAALFMFSNAADAQVYSRPRIVPNIPQQQQPQQNANRTTTPNASQPTQSNVMQRPTLTNKIVVVNQTPSQQQQAQQFVRKTVDSRPVNPAVVGNLASSLVYSPSFSQKMQLSIQSKLGIRYVYGTEGPYTYDCSGFVWSVFRDAGFSFERTSARSLWLSSEPVAEEEKFKFGTLVFFNKLGHMGIVADANGFYHASTSKGITYSPFVGYWGKRIVGFRRLPVRTN
jgi:peptidoglycan endopeptidase LytE